MKLRGGRKLKYFNLLANLAALIFSAYFLYLAFKVNDSTLLVLRIIAAVGWIIISFHIFKEIKTTKRQRIEKWFFLERPNGFLCFILKWSVLWVFVGYTQWLLWGGIEDVESLLVSLLKHSVFYVVTGFLLGWYSWKTNIRESKEMGLDTYNN